MSQGLTQAQVVERLARLDRNVKLLAEHLGVRIEDPTDGLDPEVVELARSGSRMQAAKLYADRTGADFVTAQKVVNQL